MGYRKGRYRGNRAIPLHRFKRWLGENGFTQKRVSGVHATYQHSSGETVMVPIGRKEANSRALRRAADIAGVDWRKIW